MGVSRPQLLQLAVWDYAFRFHLLPLARACRDGGFDVLCAGAPGPFAADVEAEGFRYLPLPLHRSVRPDRLGSAVRALVRLLRREHVDMVHAHTVVGGIVGRLATPRATPYVYTAHGLHTHDAPSRLVGGAYRLAEGLATRGAAAVFVQHGEDREALIARGMAQPERVLMIGNGIDLARFADDPDRPDRVRQIRADLGIPDDALVVSIIARATRTKGMPEFAQLALALRETRPGVHFVAVAPVFEGERGAARDDLDAAVHAGANLHVLSYRRDVADLLALTDVFVLPSRFEGVSKILMEAMAMGVPAVATDVRGCRGVVRPGETGTLVPLDDERALVRAVDDLLGSPETRRRYGARARAIARDEFDEARPFALQVDVLRRIAGLA